LAENIDIRRGFRLVLRLTVGHRKRPIVWQRENVVQQLDIGYGFLNVHTVPILRGSGEALGT
jgi:hypothetical protein